MSRRRRNKRNNQCGSGYDSQNDNTVTSSAGYQQDNEWETRGNRNRGRNDWQDDQSMMCSSRDDYPDWP